MPKSPTSTSDNPPLSEVTNASSRSVAVAINCKDLSAINCISGSALVAEFLRASLAPNTRRAYQSDLRHFQRWGGTIPASAEVIAYYLAAHANTHRIATLQRRLASLTKAHAILGGSSPVDDDVVIGTMRGIRRSCGARRDEAKPLVREELFAVLDAIGSSPKDVRDRALLLLGFAGGFRRSELVGLDVDNIEQVRQGLIVHLRRSKTDQAGEGRKIGVPLGRTRHCPVSALDQWLRLIGRSTGPIFSPIARSASGGIRRLSAEAVSVIVKERVSAVAIDPTRYSGHSLRAGFATSAAQAGVPSWKIRAQTGHASDAMLARYIRDGEIFVENAAAALL